MTFKEQFPGLYHSYDIVLDKYEDSYSEEAIEKFCLDKQKVKEAWNNMLEHAKRQSEYSNSNIYDSFANELFYMFNKELGL